MTRGWKMIICVPSRGEGKWQTPTTTHNAGRTRDTSANTVEGRGGWAGVDGKRYPRDPSGRRCVMGYGLVFNWQRRKTTTNKKRKEKTKTDGDGRHAARRNKNLQVCLNDIRQDQETWEPAQHCRRHGSGNDGIHGCS